MFADNELEAAVRGAMRAGLPVVATMTFDTGGRTMMGVRPVEAMKASKALPAKPVAFGANCGIGPAQLIDSILGLAMGAEAADVIVAKSNCGLPVMGDDMKVRYDGTPKIMADYAKLARDAGARIIGGCCGTTAAHVAAMVEALACHSRKAPPSYADIEQALGPIRKNTTLPQATRRPARSV
jgi:5-methyltetrahydrofolate--homocysteine methyltransferase